MKDTDEITSMVDAIKALDSKTFRKFRTSIVPNYRIGTDYKYPFGIWFRGLADASWKLTPGIFRQSPKIYIEEASMFHHFQLRVSEHRQTYQSKFEWLCLMRHYDLSTRLLDWKESVLIGLFLPCMIGGNTIATASYVSLTRTVSTSTRHTRAGNIRRIFTTAFDSIVRAQLAASRNLKRFKGSMPRLLEAANRSSAEVGKILEELES